MRITQLRQADLNLLVVFTVLAEERNVSRAATRLLLSQPAVSRALQRLRDMFHDDLLVRTSKGYETTAQGQRLLQELEVMLPKLDRLLSGSSFDPALEQATFRIAATDNAASVLAPVLCRDVLPTAKKVMFDFSAWRDGVFDDLDHGRLDLVLNAEDGFVPSHLQAEAIYEEDFVCVVAAEAEYPRRLSLKQYLEAEHVGVGIFGGRQTIPERRLGAAGHKRRTVIQVPYFSTAIRSVVGTELIATVPKRLAMGDAHHPGIRLVKPPPEMTGYRYMMIWHPRVNTDAAHAWLRSAMRSVGHGLGSQKA
ncbi:MAG: Transcriptional regulator [Acidobacteriaceae bacterium]|nr:Transcriptional regulator [Acidobacteriaceae bacterium]